VSDQPRMTALQRNYPHLGLHRRMILLRSVGAAAVSLAPVPYLDEWLASSVRRGTIRRLADARRVDLTEPAVRAIADGKVAPPTWKTLVDSTLLSQLMKRAWRSIIWTLAIYRRAEQASRTFAVGTLFDHYCARVHVGGELDQAGAEKVRDAIDEALRTRGGGLGTRLFRQGFLAAGRAALRAPVEIADALTGGLLLRRRSAGDDAEAEEIVDEALAARAVPGSLIGRAVAAVELQFAAAGADYVDRLVTAFETAYRARTS